MRIMGHGIDVVKIAEIKDEVDSTNKRWTEQFCSADERVHAGTAPTVRKRDRVCELCGGKKVGNPRIFAGLVVEAS